MSLGCISDMQTWFKYCLWIGPMVFVYSKLRLKSFSTYVVWPLTLNTKPIAKIRSFTCQNSELDFFNPSSGTRESPPVLLDTGHEEPDDLAQFKIRSFPLQTAICPVSYFCIFFLLGQNILSGTIFDILTHCLWKNLSRLTAPGFEPGTT